MSSCCSCASAAVLICVKRQRFALQRLLLAERFYIIQSGRVAIIDRSRNVTLAMLNAGESFGEQSLISSGVRSMAAQVIGATICMEITAQSLREVLASEGRIVTPLFEALMLQLYMHNAICAAAPQTQSPPPRN
jgi:CRP-like cAMP-binding protein